MADTKAEILETAQQILLESGYDALTASRIADRMDITDAGVHYHFETTADLAVGVVEHLEAVYRERLRTHEGPPEDRLAAIVREQFEGAEALRELTAPPSFQLITAASSGNERLRDALVSVTEMYVEEIAGVVADGIDAGVFETDDPDRVATFLASTTDAAAVRTALGQSSRPIAESVTEHVLADLYVDDPPSVAPDGAPTGAEVDG